jgi:hypothetical protein
MKLFFRWTSLVVVLAAAALWLASGANRGWTKTSVEKRTMDEVTGLEGITYEQRFVPGVDFLGGAVLAAGILAGASLMFRTKPNTQLKT